MKKEQMNGDKVSNHFPDIGKMVDIGSRNQKLFHHLVEIYEVILNKNRKENEK